ncbi:DUF742 domain-containing protein [Marinitenerispora sediminis]|uniref:DUF742 domain-containing protein n=1 Tax=Marinitenerispora sediminis TaxID=1931232 RepID=UPI0035A9538C
MPAEDDPGAAPLPEPRAQGGPGHRSGAPGGRLPGRRPAARPGGPGFSLTDAAAGPLVRPYAMTGGRTRPDRAELDMITVVVAARRPPDTVGLEPEHLAILDLCTGPVSVAEVSAHLDIPLTVVKVLVSDLIARGAMLARAPLPTAQLPEKHVLQAVLDGIRRL